jgi:IS605 OrfB family transposase
VYLIRTDFGRLAKRYEAVRNAKLEELKRKHPYAGRDDEEKVQNVTDTREFRKFVRRLRERRRKEGRVRQIARQMTKSPAVIITEELGKNPQEEMIGLEKKKVKKRELRHRVKQTPFRKLLKSIEDKAAEGGSAVFYVSSFRNSRVCPIHFALLKNGSGWHVLHCPHGHPVDRDAAVLNMLWKITPEGVVKGVWWDVKEVRKRLKKGRGLVPKEAMRRRNPLVPWPVVCAVWVSLRALKASLQWPAVLARAAPMTPAQGADEGGTRAPPRRAPAHGEEVSLNTPFFWFILSLNDSPCVGRKKTVCLYLEAELVKEVAQFAEEQNVSLSGLAEEALRLYVAFLKSRPRPKLQPRPPPPQGHTPPPPPPTPPSHHLPSHLQNNPWISVLRSKQ